MSAPGTSSVWKRSSEVWTTSVQLASSTARHPRAPAGRLPTRSPCPDGEQRESVSSRRCARVPRPEQRLARTAGSGRTCRIDRRRSAVIVRSTSSRIVPSRARPAWGLPRAGPFTTALKGGRNGPHPVPRANHAFRRRARLFDAHATRTPGPPPFGTSTEVTMTRALPASPPRRLCSPFARRARTRLADRSGPAITPPRRRTVAGHPDTCCRPRLADPRVVRADAWPTPTPAPAPVASACRGVADKYCSRGLSSRRLRDDCVQRLEVPPRSGHASRTPWPERVVYGAARVGGTPCGAADRFGIDDDAQPRPRPAPNARPAA